MRLADTALGGFVLFIYPRIARPDDQVSAEWWCQRGSGLTRLAFTCAA